MKRSVKNFLKIIAITMSLAALTTSFVACGGNENSTSGGNSGSNTSTSGNNSSDSSDSSATVTYTVHFETNGGSAVSSSVVTEGDTLSVPNEPTKEGYLFTGWYTDAELENAYDFETEVKADMTLYAAWTDAANANTVTYYMNDGTDEVYTTSVFKKGARYQNISKPANPARDGYRFLGWYKDKDCTEQYSALNKISEDISLFAKWEYAYTFEAEHTYLDGKDGKGYSGSTSGTGMVVQSDMASNGYYVAWMYYNGAFLEFEINNNSEEEVSGVTIEFALSAQWGDVEVTGDQIYIGVNYDEDSEDYEQKYDYPLSVPSAGEYSDKVYAFKNYTLSSTITLKPGKNTIAFVVNNSIKGTGGTMNAACPLIDCMYVYTTAELTMTKYNTNEF